MDDKVVELLVVRMNRTHHFIEATVSDLSQEDLCLRPASTAPPIGWHIWHITRWADWFQASFPNQTQLWETQQLSLSLGLDDMALGPMQTGMTMSHDDAAQIPIIIGKERLIDYMKTVFALNKTVLSNVALDDLYQSRESFAKWDSVDGKIIRTKGKDVTLVDDIGYHLTHANRHLGMIEGLIGAVLDRSGTASI
jgi:hypothetical protein